MILDKEYLIRVLQYGQFGGLVSTDDYYVRVKYDDFSILLRPENNRVDFWVQTNYAYVATSVPHPDYKNSYVSKAIRWVFGRILEELTATYKVFPAPDIS